MSLINTYYLATNGQNSIETYTLASNGILYGIEIEDIIPPTGGAGPGIGDFTSGKKEKKKKKVTITAYVDDIEYKESIIVENKPNLTIKDISVEINKVLSESKVKINIQIL